MIFWVVYLIRTTGQLDSQLSLLAPPVRLNGVETPQFIDMRTAESLSTTATADFIYQLDCNGADDATFELRAEGGYPSNILEIRALFMIPDDTNYAPLSIPVSGPVITLTNLPAGLYVFEARDTNPPPGRDACVDVLTIRVEEPEAYGIELIDSTVPVCPEDLLLGGRLVYEISGGALNAGPYTVSLNGGLLTNNSGLNNVVEFTNIDITNPLLRTINQIEITDNFGCTSGIITNRTFTFDEVYEYEVNNLVINNIDCTNNISGQISFSIDAISTPPGPAISPTNPAQLYIRGNAGNYEYYETITSTRVVVDNFLQDDTYFYSVTLNNALPVQ